MSPPEVDGGIPSPIPPVEPGEEARILYIAGEAAASQGVVDGLAEVTGRWRVTLVEGGEPRHARLDAAAFDLVLVDLPDDDDRDGAGGRALLRRLLAGDDAPPVIPVLPVKALGTAVEALQFGAADFVLRDGGGSERALLPRVVARVLERQRLERAKRAAEAELAHQIQVNQGVIDNIDQGISLYDRNLRLVRWNDRYRELFDLPESLTRKGARFEDIIRYNAEHGEYPSERPEDAVRDRVRRARGAAVHRYDHVRATGAVIEVRGGPMPDGGFIATYTDVTDRRRMEDELRRLATVDPLTGANNRRHFLERAKREAARCRRYDRDLCIVLLDIDHFKSINDTHGHAAGDQVLRTLAKVCMTQLRETDVFARFGGEEFIAALPDTSLTVAADAAERLRRVLERTPTPLSEDREGEIYVTVSLGVAAFTDEDSDIQQVIHRADGALYAAKEAGRNRVRAG